jgi:hypothetical protein
MELFSELGDSRSFDSLGYYCCEISIAKVSKKQFDCHLADQIWRDLVSPVTQAALIHCQGCLIGHNDFCETLIEKVSLTAVSTDQI